MYYIRIVVDSDNGSNIAHDSEDLGDFDVHLALSIQLLHLSAVCCEESRIKRRARAV